MATKEAQKFIPAKCDKCEMETRVQESHLGRKHKVCGGKRTFIGVPIPSMAWTYGKHKKAPLFGRTPTGEAVRFYIRRVQGDRSKHGTWRLIEQ